MSWMRHLADVYDNNKQQVGNYEKRYKRLFTLMPIAHVIQNAQIEITLTKSGVFHRAEVIKKDDAPTIVPASLDSANRAGSKIAPHYLHDKLFYVAKDYVDYGSNRKRDLNYEAYEKQMMEWVKSGEAPPKVESVTKYIKKGQLVKDLIEAKIIYVDESGNVIEKWTQKETDKYKVEKPDLYKETLGTAFDAFVRFNVLKERPEEKDVWKDTEIYESFIRFIDKQMKQDESIEKGLCYITGEDVILSTQHGSKLRHAGDQSKIISANDKSGYTYRGRFKEATEAAQIGYEVSQKSHQALRWLIQRQGINVDSRYFLTFGSKSSDVPEPFSNSLDFYDLFEDVPLEAEPETEELAAKEISKAIQGYANNIEGFYDSNIITLGLDAATSGRLAIVYYQEVSPEIYLDALITWHKKCRWKFTYKDHGQTKSYFGAPSTYSMAKAIYGDKSNPAVKKEFYTRILPSILDGRKIPNDMIQSIYHRIIRPESFRGTMESWEGTLSVGCAMINYNTEKEVTQVSLQTDNTNRDYLFGRLLAISEVLEHRILQEQNEKRTTNATRYFNAFANRPARTWLIIRKQIQPYFSRLDRANTQQGVYYRKLIQEIESLIGPERMTDKSLTPIFLVGYSSQVQEMYKKVKDDK